jgi:hypothetical protein
VQSTGDNVAHRVNELAGRHFVSVEMLKTGGSPTGPKFAHKHISFGDKMCGWGYANVFVYGAFTLSHSGSIEACFGPEVAWTVSGSYDARTSALIWDGARYRLEPPLDRKTLEVGRDPNNRRIRALVTYLADGGFKFQHTESGHWRVTQPGLPYDHVLVRLWSFPAKACDWQIQAAIAAADEEYHWNVVSHVAMSDPICWDTDGKTLEQPPDDELVPQLNARFNAYRSCDTAWESIINPGGEPNDPRVQALIRYFEQNGIHLEPDERDLWRLTKPAFPDGYEMAFSVRTFPEWASEEQMRVSLMQINLAYMLNAPAQLAMSYSGGGQTATDDKMPWHNGLPVNEAVYKLFRDYVAH